jgi:hypothetical protein
MSAANLHPSQKRMVKAVRAEFDRLHSDIRMDRPHEPSSCRDDSGDGLRRGQCWFCVPESALA